MTPNNTSCCASAETGGAPLGNWYFPNGTEIPLDSTRWLFYISRGPGVVRLHRRTGGVSGIYHCVIPDLTGVNQTLYVGLYAIALTTSGKQLTIIESGKQNKIYVLYMSDGKHYPCCVPMSYLWSSVDQDFLPACTFKKIMFSNFCFENLSFNCCLFYSS